jgi:hypothetical protein
MQNVVLGHEIATKLLLPSTDIGSLQVPLASMMALPPLSTATQNDTVGHEIAARP